MGSLSTLVTLHNKYMRSKDVKNMLERYALMREMIKEAVKIESTWWALMEIPLQNRAENFASYVLRVCNTIETVRIPLTSEANSFRESKKEKDNRVEKVNGKKIFFYIGNNFPQVKFVPLQDIFQDIAKCCKID